MYRDDATSGRARFEAAERRLQAVLADAEAAHDEAYQAHAAVREAGGEVLPLPPAPAPGPLPPAPPEGADRAAYDAAADAREARAADLERHAAALATLAEGLRRRHRGQKWVEPLGPAPRPVPRLYLVAEWLGCFAGSLMSFMIAMPLGIAGGTALAGASPTALAALLGTVTLTWIAYATLRARERARYLAEGVLLPTRLVSENHNSTSMKNWPLRRAVGWRQRTIGYTGAGRRSEIAAQLPDGREETFKLSGCGWHGAAVLWVSGARVRPVMHFHSIPHPDVRGAWNPRLQALAWTRLVRGAIVLGALVLVTFTAWTAAL